MGLGGKIRLGTVKVPDDRIDTLSAIFSPKKTTYAEMRFCDIPGEYGADKKGLSPLALQQIRDQEALCLVLRDFENLDLAGAPDPSGDLQAFSAECLLADLEIVERRLDRARKEGADAVEILAFEKAYATLVSERSLRLLSTQELNRELFRGYGLLADRPLLVILNQAEGNAADGLPETLKAEIRALGAGGLALSASVEAEIADLDVEDQAAFLEDLGLEKSALTRFIRASYALLDLISFFTVGPDEVRAWTITRGMTARPAAGCIHSDLERGFIRAEVTPYDVFMEYGSEHAVKEAGRLQVEGKNYVLSDGDILHVRFNV